MTERKDFKKIVRARMAETGESYTAARAALEPSVVGRAPSWTLRELQDAASAEARRLCTSYVGPAHAIVALMRLGSGQMSHDALLRAGMTLAIAEAGVVERRPEPVATMQFNPAYLIIEGRAEGLSAAHGIGGLAEHFLAAMLWDRNAWRRWDDQVPRGVIAASLARSFVALPRTPMPDIDPFRETQRVDLTAEQLDPVLEELQRMRAETGARFGFNWRDDGTAYVVADDSIDLAAAVARVVATAPDS